MSLKVTKHLGYFRKKICRQEFSNIAQFGHTVNVINYHDCSQPKFDKQGGRSNVLFIARLTWHEWDQSSKHNDLLEFQTMGNLEKFDTFVFR